MDTLKDIIVENSDLFCKESLPEGDIERFEKRMDSTIRIKRRFKIVAYPIAAALLILLSLGIFAPVNESRSIEIYKDYCKEVGMITSEIQIMSSDNERKSYEREIESITFEAIPLFNQLPEEMSDREKAKAVKEYYSQKLEGIRRLKVLVADTNIEE